MSNLLVTIGAPICTLVIVIFGWRLFAQRRIPVPPGPKGYPIIGNLLDMPKEQEWLVFRDMIYVSVLGQHFLVVSSVKIAADLLEKRSAIYSGRMRFIFGGELCNYNRGIALKEGTSHREARKCAHRGLNSTAVKQWQWLQEEEAHKTLRKLVQCPAEFAKQFRSNAASSIMKIAYGYELERDDDPWLHTANQVMEEFSEGCSPGRWMVDGLPFLKHVPAWIPGAGFQNTALICKDRIDHMFSDPFNLVKERMAVGTVIPSMTAQLLERNKESTDEELIKNALGSLYGGGVDTTPSALTSFVKAMLLYPDVQKSAKEELDRVVGQERLPVFADRSKLPYMNALIKEVLRWATIVPLGVPHRLIKDDVYNGYSIPKDTIVLTNIWRMTRDTSTYGPDVDSFRPERFLGPNPAPQGFSTSNTREFGSPLFGFGRRVCPGEHLAEASLFITCSNILAAMDISPVMGDDGMPLLPDMEYSSGVIVHPTPFKCNIRPRSPNAAELINRGRPTLSH
ncbi:cytochrome P450 [Calocera viscosa TUFC12733]|uniref:Cytochrome P450 n=1 Tax=Calocera viscosa (strain TUFC12733) TaxID=1330018 RepID=A0A167KT09_CALVF|nr:cytochrome P450 [Calocera viscosa TUFC12733]